MSSERSPGIVQQYISGRSVEEIAKEYGVHRNSIYQFLERDKQRMARYKVERKNHRAKQILQMWLDGYTIPELCEKWELSRRRIIDIVREECRNQQIPQEEARKIAAKHWQQRNETETDGSNSENRT